MQRPLLRLLPVKTKYKNNALRGEDVMVACMPHKVVRAAKEKITEAFNAQDYKACYRLFDGAYVFIPTTGERWGEMGQAGIK